MMDSIPQNPLKVLEELCKHPVLYVNTHFRDYDGNKCFVVSVSNEEPHIVEDKREAIWMKSALVVDIFYDPSLYLENLNTEILCSLTHWVKTLCYILTFKGHEVFIENKLFQPFEDEHGS